MNTLDSFGELTFLSGGGEMGERIRAYSWELTPLGPIGTWPQSLKTSVGLMLNSKHPIWIGWGTEATFLYNDAYIQVLSLAKHPWALGKPAHQVWAEIWDICGPLADKVFHKGQASFLDDVRLFMRRGDFLEETFYSFSYTPVRDESGSVGGLFCPSTEVTSKVLNARRLSVLSDLGAEAARAKSISGACTIAASILAKAPDDIPFALFYLVDWETNVARLEQAIGVSKGHPIISPLSLGILGETKGLWPIQEITHQGSKARVVSIEGIAGFPTGAAEQDLREVLILPIASRGEENCLGVLIAGVNPTRKLDADYSAFFNLVAGHLAAAIQNAGAAEEERRRAEMLMELDRAKTAFFSNVSHELRTPLTLILGPLEDGLRETTSPPVWLELAHRNSIRLLKLVNSLLDFSRLEAGRVEVSFEPTDLAVFTSELASVFRSGVERAGLKLIVECQPLPEPIYIDRDMWEKVVFNLLSNALKFTKVGQIEVKLALEESISAVCLTVRDTGIGIPRSELPRIFERFKRVRTEWARSHEGTGIGLALVQELVHLHGGTVTVESEEGQGTKFAVTIPRGAFHLPEDRIAAPRTEPSVSTTGASFFIEEAQRWLSDSASASENEKNFVDREPTVSKKSRGRIVLADDNGDMRGYVNRLLTSCGFEVTAVGDGLAALETVRELRPALVLSDVMMPRLDGFGLLKELRKDPETSSIPIILLSARAGEEARVEGVEAGADDYLTKPFSARELVARVTTHLDLARVRKEAYDLVLQREEELNRAHRQLQNVLGSITDGLAVLDKRWNFTFFSEQAARIVGTSAQDLVGTCVWDMFPKAKGTRFFDGAHRAMDGHVVHFEEFYPEPINKWLECHCYPSNEGLSVYFHDVSERKAAEEALHNANAQLASRATHLESLVQQRTAKLSETVGELEAFSYSIAHDMRAPLRSLQGFSHILLDEHQDQLDAEGKDFLHRIAKAAARMDNLIQDVLSYSRVVRNESFLNEVDVSKLLEGILETYPMFDDGRADIHLQKPFPLVLGNEAMLMQVFSNLLGNAVKFVPEGIKPSVKVWAEVRDPHVRFFFKDNGIGIELDQQEKIFEIFQKVGKGSEGTGIGLAIVRKAIERMGGRVGVISDLGQGSTFWIDLPEAPEKK